MRLGPFTVDDTGGLSPGNPDCFPTFTLRWHDRVVQVRMRHGVPGASAGSCGALAISSIVGRVPSTAGCDSDQAGLRSAAFAMMRGLPAALPAGWQADLLADHRIGVSAELHIGLPTNAASLITEVSLFLLDLGPYLDLLDEAGMAGDGAGAAGEAVAGRLNI